MTINNIIQKVHNFLFETSITKFFLIIVTLAIFSNGLMFVSSSKHLFISSLDIFSNQLTETPNVMWLLSSFLGSITSYFLGIDNFKIFILFHLIVFLFGFFVLTKIIAKYDDYLARVFLLFFFTMPISNILFTWLGFTDIFTFLLGISIVLSKSKKILLFIFASLLGLSHAYQGFVIIILLNIFYFFSNRKIDYNFLITSFLGVLFGILSLKFFFHYYEFNIIDTRFGYFEKKGFMRYFLATFSNFLPCLFSLFNLMWLVIILVIRKLYRFNYNNIATSFILTMILSFIVMIFTLDQSRVYNLIMFPVLIAFLFELKIQNILKKINKKIFTYIFILSIFIPNYYIWDGKIHATSYYQIFLKTSYMLNKS